MDMKIRISEQQYKTIIKEYYDSERLYDRSYVVERLIKGPKELKKYIPLLQRIECQDDKGNKSICTKVPEVVYVYLSGNY